MPSRKNADRIVEITAVVPCQASEAVENFLLEAGSLGTSIEQFNGNGSTETVRAYFSVDRRVDRIEAALGAYLKAIENYVASPGTWQISGCILDEDWKDRWKAFFKTTRVTRGIVIKPTWEAYTAKGQEIVIEIDPGMAFGTGLHATTRLCLQAIHSERDRRIRENRLVRETPLSLLDVGTGSGVLAIAAAKLGLRPVMAIDIDETAIEIARQNVKRNKVARVVRISRKRLEAVKGCFDFVVANLDLKTLLGLRESLTAHVSHGGRLVLSGILGREKAAINAALCGGGFQIVSEKKRAGWTCLVLERI
jgi:ribosomal protein L11 methyltransferase